MASTDACPMAIIQALDASAAEIDGVCDGATFTAAEGNDAADPTVFYAEYTATAPAAIPSTVRVIELNHATVAIEKTIADLANYANRLVIIKNTSASGTAAHTVTLTAGTFDGTNNVATLNAPNEFLAVWVDSAGNGTVLENVGAVGLS